MPIMEPQTIKHINIKSLILWTENPRDPITGNAKNQDIIDRALADKKDKWQLKQLAAEMGDLYDFSELPTVVYHGRKPVVYDGNRRVILAKISKGYATSDIKFKRLPKVPSKIPCNVCSKEVAIDNIYRKHSKSGSWAPLERDMFLCQYKHLERSPFMVIDEFMNGAIGEDKILNQVFVKDEIFSNASLASLGIKIENGALYSKHSVEQTKELLADIFCKIKSQEINTRSNRGDVGKILKSDIRKMVERDNSHNEYALLVPHSKEQVSECENSQNEGNDTDKNITTSETANTSTPPSPFSSIDQTKAEQGNANAGNALVTGFTPRVKEAIFPIFAKRIKLRQGNVNNLYRDVAEICLYREENPHKFTSRFIGIVRMAMRLVVETARRSEGLVTIDAYVKNHFKEAKPLLSPDELTYMSNNNVTEKSLVRLLQNGAHNYMASLSEDQARAIALIVEAMLFKSHGKK